MGLGRNLREKNVFVRVKGDDGGGMRECVLSVERQVSVLPPLNLSLCLLQLVITT